MSSESMTPPTPSEDAGMPRKKNAASQFRSMRKRISHPLLDPMEDSTAAPSSSTTSSYAPSAAGSTRPSYATPPRNNLRAAVTPDLNRSPESAALVDALKMAARPSSSSGRHEGGEDKNDGDAATATAAQSSTTYASSIEAMAAHVEATHRKRRGGTTPIKSAHAARTSRTRHARSDSGNLSIGTGKLSTSSRSSHSSSRRGEPSHPPPPSTHWKIWLLATPVLLSFLACEAFLWLLVLRFRDSPAVLILTTDFHVEADTEMHSEGVIDEDSKIIPVRGHIDEEREIIPVSDDIDSFIVNYVNSNEDGVDVFEGEPRDEIDKESYGELARLQTALDEGFAKLMHSDEELGDTSNGEKVDSLCGDVWAGANEMLSSKYLNYSARSSTVQLVGSGETRFDESKESEVNILKSLTLRAQQCLGGAGIAFLSSDGLDHARLRITTKVFDGLIEVEPYNPDVRAGLGTSLLMQGIFYQEIREGVDDNVQNSLLSLASHHLKLASLLSTSSSSGDDGSISLGTDNAMSRLTNVNYENAASHAAILHNLGLSYVAMGDFANSVPILLRSAAMRREHTASAKPYWNVPNDVLQAAEEMALLIAAAPKKEIIEKKSKRRRIPFVSYLREDKSIEGR